MLACVGGRLRLAEHWSSRRPSAVVTLLALAETIWFTVSERLSLGGKDDQSGFLPTSVSSEVLLCCSKAEGQQRDVKGTVSREGTAAL